MKKYFFPTVRSRNKAYTDVWVIGATVQEVVKAADAMRKSHFPEEGEDDAYLFANGLADDDVITFETDLAYGYTGRRLSKELSGALVFTMDSWDSFGFGAYKNGKLFKGYNINFVLEAASDLEGWGELMYTPKITVCTKEDGKELFTTDVTPIPARYVAGLVTKNARLFDAVCG